MHEDVAEGSIELVEGLLNGSGPGGVRSSGSTARTSSQSSGRAASSVRYKFCCIPFFPLWYPQPATLRSIFDITGSSRNMWNRGRAASSDGHRVESRPGTSVSTSTSLRGRLPNDVEGTGAIEELDGGGPMGNRSVSWWSDGADFLFRVILDDLD
nr:hypothetical protein Iba_scaffold68583CG0010 [Ipomoea batatas]